MLIAFPLQQWLQERASMIRYKYIVSFFTGCSFTFYLSADDHCR